MDAPRDTSAILVVWSAASADALVQLRLALSFLAQEAGEAAHTPSIDDFFTTLNEGGARVRYCECNPNMIEEVIELGASQGYKQILVVPIVLVLDAAPHAALTGELPARIAEVNARHPDVDIVYLGPPYESLHRINLFLNIAHERAPQAIDLLKDTVARGFKSDWMLFTRFMQTLQSALPVDTRVALRGSAVTGVNYTNGQPFDAKGPGTSDLDLVLMGEQAMAEWKQETFYFPNVNTMPLSDETPDVAPRLNPVRVELQQMVNRPVNMQAMQKWFLDMRSELQGTPYVFLDG